jgi:ArsR family transcriptional regulator
MLDLRLYEERANILKALAHPTRLIILDELLKEEKCVCELQKVIDKDMSTVSKHLLVMKNAGIVESKKVKNSVYYSLKIRCFSNFFSCVEEIIDYNAKEKLKIIK